MTDLSIKTICPNPNCKKKLIQFKQYRWTSNYCTNKCYRIKWTKQDNPNKTERLSETIFIHPYTVINTWKEEPILQLTLKLNLNPEIELGCHVLEMNNESDKLEAQDKKKLIVSLKEPKEFNLDDWNSIKSWIVNVITFL